MAWRATCMQSSGRPPGVALYSAMTPFSCATSDAMASRISAGGGTNVPLNENQAAEAQGRITMGQCLKSFGHWSAVAVARWATPSSQAPKFCEFCSCARQHGFNTRQSGHRIIRTADDGQCDELKPPGSWSMQCTCTLVVIHRSLFIDPAKVGSKLASVDNINLVTDLLQRWKCCGLPLASHIVQQLCRKASHAGALRHFSRKGFCGHHRCRKSVLQHHADSAATCNHRRRPAHHHICSAAPHAWVHHEHFDSCTAGTATCWRAQRQ